MANPVTTKIKEILVDGIMGSLNGLFDYLNDLLVDVAEKAGTSPADFSANVAESTGQSIYSTVQTISESVIVPVAGVILTFIACWELIQMVIEQNNMANLDTSIFIKWIFKTAIAIILVTNCFTITMAIFDLASEVIGGASSIVFETAELEALDWEAFEETLMEKDIGTLLLTFISSIIIYAAMIFMYLAIYIIVYSRMVEIYLTVSLAPIPFATFGNREQSQIGQNYLKSIAALAFQGFLIVVCIGIYEILLQTIVFTDEVLVSVWTLVGYTALLTYSLFRTGSLTKSIFGAH